jgi:hypothetical protein
VAQVGSWILQSKLLSVSILPGPPRNKRCTFRIRTWIRAEVSRLIHIIPEPIDINTRPWIKEAQKLLIPVPLGIRVEPIRENSRTRPDRAFKERAISTLLVDVELGTVVITVIAAAPDGGIDHHYVVLLVGVEMLDELLDQVQRIAFRVEGEETAELHVVDVCPHSLLRL